MTLFVTIFVVALIVVVMIHEFGHYATAKAFGMKVEKFFFGFGPTLWSFRRGETEYGVKAVPAGGFVKIVGMSSFEEIDPGDEARTFHSKPAWQRAIVLAAGSATHFVVAAVLLFAGLALIGLPTGEATNEIAGAVPEGPAAEAGLSAGDVIVAVDGVRTADFEAVREAVVARGGQTVPVTVERDGRLVERRVTIAPQTPQGEEIGFLGVSPRPEIRRVPVGRALRDTFVGDLSIARLTELTVVGLGQAFSPEGLSSWLGELTSEGPRDPEGPLSIVGAAQIAGTLGQQHDLFGFLLILVQLNIVIGLLNMLPLPPLDGGHLAVLVVEESVTRVRRLRGNDERFTVDPSRLTPIALAVIMFFGAIMITAVFVDIVKPASELFR